MKEAIVKLESAGPYSQSRQYEREIPKTTGESNPDYEERTWRYRCHVNRDGFIIIPPSAITRCIQDAAGYLKMQIPGKGKQTYTKNFKAGLLIPEPAVLPIKRDEVEGEWLSLSGRGIRGQRGVWKCMPLISAWSATFRLIVWDEALSADVLEAHLAAAGMFIGIGRYRPLNGGFYGRFVPKDFQWV